MNANSILAKSSTKRMNVNSILAKSSAKRMNVNSRGCQPTEKAMQRPFDPERVQQFGQKEFIAQWWWFVGAIALLSASILLTWSWFKHQTRPL